MELLGSSGQSGTPQLGEEAVMEMMQPQWGWWAGAHQAGIIHFLAPCENLRAPNAFTRCCKASKGRLCFM